jgi:DNA-binding helix-hairpin-helix protein with protein kinase domain
VTVALFTGSGERLALGRELGRGGEGAVYDVVGRPDQVAKVYHRTPDARKQEKLRFMARTADAQLLTYVAWPQETLHPQPGGPVTGFTMPRIKDREPIHLIYSPAHRRQDHPDLKWSFLLYAARNVAASFAAVHDHGHVVGDVNQNSFMVHRDSRVVLIDADSFQIDAGGVLHHCEVGVSHFTPPELQSLKSFAGYRRTPNHDAFGLALLVFHLLFGGRHPYSGVPLVREVGNALETDIAAFRYAYASDHRKRGFDPPPRSIPIALVPDAVGGLFERAFTEAGAAGRRPTAREWVTALDAVRTGLRSCSASPMHVHPAHLKDCPWCALERQGVVFFIDVGVGATATSSGFVLTHVWARIEAVKPPQAFTIPAPNTAVTATPLPAGVLPGWSFVLARVIVFAAVVGLAVGVWSFGWGWAALLAFVIERVTAAALGASRATERQRRTEALRRTQGEYGRLVTAARATAEEFTKRRSELEALRNEHAELPKREQAALDRLRSTARDRQLKQHLEVCFIDRADIPGVGPTRKAALRSFGIETAYDVDRASVMAVRGFGETLTRAMLAWRHVCEQSFRFDPSRALSPADVAATRRKFLQRRAIVEATLKAGANELTQLRDRIHERQAAMTPQLRAAAEVVAQAQADVRVMG